jgi:hypothetical protein
MSVSRTKATVFAVTLSLFSGTAMAQNLPLALPPSAGSDSQKPVIISAPEPAGLALPPAPPPAAEKPPASPPVEAAPPSEAKTDAIGLRAANEGGLGAGLWKGTPRAVAERFLPLLPLPMPYAALNDLAERFLLTTAGSPEGSADAANNRALTVLRVDRLAAIGKQAEAWRLIDLAGTDQIDDKSLRMLAEAALVSAAAADVCVKLPALMKTHAGIEWQKSMLVCQLAANDTKAAQVSLDLLHAQDVHDDTFFALAEKNIIAGNKQLPRQLTPLKPLTLALLRLAGLPVRGEVYAHPDPVLIPELLKAKAADETSRLSLAERAAAKGLIGAGDLAGVYSSEVFAPDTLSDANISGERGARLRALLYQASQLEKNPRNRVNEAVKFLESFDQEPAGGGIALLLGNILGDVQPSADFNADAAKVTRIYILANKLAKNAARGMPQVAADLQNLWPIATLAGLESDKDFARDCDAWLASALHASNPQDVDAHAQKTVVALLLLLDAVGFPVGDEIWAKTADGALPEKISVPPAWVMERLRAAAAANRKGEAVLMGLLATAGGKEDPSLLALVETIRALRAVGLASDAANLAKEAALRILYAPVKP